MKQYLLGIDVGTTGTKGMLLSETGEQMGHAYVGYPMQTPGVCRNEQQAEDWWQALVEVTHALVKTPATAAQVKAICLSTQGGTLVPVDAKYRPLHPAIVWSDGRCTEQMHAFGAQLGEAYMYEKTGWRLGAGLNALQIAWLREHAPDVFKHTRYFLSVPDFLHARMAGVAAVDISNVGINQLADIRAAAYDKRILAFAGVEEAQLAKIVQSGTPLGRLTKEAAAALGLQPSTLLVAGAHDQYAALLGAGVLHAGDVLLGTGTAWVVTVLTASPNFQSGFSQSVSALPGKWGSMVSMSTGGIALDWLRKHVLKGPSGEALGYAALNERASSSPIGAHGLRFYPYFNGAAYPLTDAASKASFTGLDLSHTDADIIRAVMEGSAFQINWILDAFERTFPIQNIKFTGGASKSPLWSQMIADIAGKPVHIPEIPDLACIGAAILAGTGSGVFSSAQEGYNALAVRETVIEPVAAHAQRYAEAFADYQKKSKRLLEVYHG